MQNITEPATLATDYLLAAFTATLAWKLTAGARPQRWWAAGLFASSVAGLAGGTVHGFVQVLPAALTAGLWLLTLEMLVLAALAVTLATAASTALQPAARRMATTAACVVFAGWAAGIPSRPAFGMAIAAYGASLLLVSIVEAGRWRTSRLEASGWLLAGVAVSAVAAAVQQAGWAPHRHFNHNDLFHVVQAGAVWLLYQGAQGLPDASTRHPS